MSTQVSAKSRAIQSVNTKYLTMSGLMAAMITIMTAYIGHIPTGVNGGYIHFGDSLIYIAAAILPTPYALAAAAIGGGLADLLTAPMWVPATVIIKMLITIPFTNKSVRIINGRNVLAAVLAYFISGISYFVAEYIIFGNATSAFLASMSGSLVQSGGSAIFFVVFGLALDRMRVKDRIKDM
ncbi:MAG: TIGR04002 family protein [Lachnospiraceae bacterium]|nr:TIGR04002 family protein [Lachnospiraceae bacterium]